LYSQVAIRTTTEPRTKVNVIWKSNSATDARNDITMLKLVAKPLRMLSEYLITIAVTRPPRTWIATVAQAQAPKFLKSELMSPDSEGCVSRIGTRAGRSEKAES